ncbi:MAG: extracellular matrix regulator RemB [Bacillota bacterium]
MYLHLGNEVMIPLRVIIGIINLEQREEKKLIIKRLGEKRVFDDEACQGQAPKSAVLTTHKIYFSCISPQTLCKRVERREICAGNTFQAAPAPDPKLE